jgi:Putative transposase
MLSQVPGTRATAMDRGTATGTAPTNYFHVVYTVPHELNGFARTSPVAYYNLLFSAGSETLLEVAADPKRLGAEIGFFSILHSWGSNLLLHPHIHCVVPAGGLSPDHQHWIPGRKLGYFWIVHIRSEPRTGD